MGELTLDLSQLDFSGTTREVQVQVGTGKATVIVPPDTRVEAHGRAGLGDTTALDRRQGGFGSNVETSSEGNAAGTLLIDVGVGIGEGTVQRGL
jgi:predicted membrane protein